MIRELLVGAAGAFGGTIGLACLLNAPRRTLLPSSLIGVLGYVLYLLLSRAAGQSEIFSYFLSTVVIAVIC